MNERYKVDNIFNLIFFLFFKKMYNKPINENFDKKAPGINSSPKGPVSLPYQSDLKPNKSLPKPNSDL